MTSVASRLTWLRARGFIVGERDPARNTAFTGKFMVALPTDPTLLPTEANVKGSWCVVGDDLEGLIRATYNNFYDGTE